jgi:flagellar basal body rod protein FlgB
MLYGFIGRVSKANDLKEALDVSAQRTRMIADRVAKATLAGADGFATTLQGVQSGKTPTEGEPVDLETEMVSLADEQLRYETTARLLQKAYQNIRNSLRDR